MDKSQFEGTPLEQAFNIIKNQLSPSTPPKVTFKVYDSGTEIGVFNTAWHEYYPIAYQKTIEDTYSLAQLTCNMLQASYNYHKKLPKYVDQFMIEASQNISREEFITDLRLFLAFGGVEYCWQCRFLRDDLTCKHKLPGATATYADTACCCGIRKEQNNG